MARTSAWRGSCSRRSASSFRWLVSVAAFAGYLCGVARPVQAQNDGPLVVVVTSNPEAPFVRRLAAELSLFGYRVEVASRVSPETDLGELLRQSGGSALIAVDQGRQTAEVVVGEAAAGGPARHEREQLDPRRRADTNAAVLAERFRARLTELGISPGPALALPPPAPARIELPRSPREPERRLWLAAGFGATSGGLGVLPNVQLELRAFPVRWLSTSAFAKWSPVAAEATAREGQSIVRLFEGGVLIDVYPVRGDVAVNVGLGAMLVSANMTGRASAPFVGREDAVLVPAGLVETGVALRLAPRVSAELRAFMGACSPRIGVRFGGRKVTDYGQPFFGASLGVAIGVF